MHLQQMSPILCESPNIVVPHADALAHPGQPSQAHPGQPSQALALGLSRSPLPSSCSYLFTVVRSTGPGSTGPGSTGPVLR